MSPLTERPPSLLRTRPRGRDRRETLPQITAGPAAGLVAAVPTSQYASIADMALADLADLSTSTAVTESKLRGLPAATFVVNRIANAVASMSPLAVYESDRTTERTPTPLVAARPMPTLGVFDFWHMAISHALYRGNFVAIPLDFDETFTARQVLPVGAEFVRCYIDRAGYTVYKIGDTVLSADQVLHVRGPHTRPGAPWALSPCENFREALGLSVNLQTYGADSYRTASVPPVVISLDVDAVKDTVAAQVQADWISHHGAGQRKPAVVPRTMNVQTLSWSPHDAEFIESRKLSLAESALIFDTDPADIGISLGSSMTYANISARQSARIVETYGPFMRRFEEAWSDLIPGDAVCLFDPERTMRMTARERAELDQIRAQTENLTRSENPQ